jgi:dihydrofolate reductase/effector-binding domain-containing protein
MRKLIVTTIVSLDGYSEGPSGDVLALPMDAAFDAYNTERIAAADTLLLGRRTYDLFRGFWPRMADNPEASADQQSLAKMEDAVEKVVVSDTVTPDQTDPWRATTRIVRRAQAREEVAELKRRPGGDILVFGSRTLWHDLMAAGLVDELHVVVGGLLLGTGTPAFPADEAARLRLLGTRRWDGSDNVLVRYAPEQVLVEEREPQATLSVRQTVPLADLPRAQGESLGEVWRFLDRQGVVPAGPPFVRYHTFGGEQTDVEVGFPVALSNGEGRIVAGTLPGGPAVVTRHLGSHDTLAEAYDRLQKAVTEHRRETAGPGWEVYEWIDPAVEPDPARWPPPAEWRTVLVQPVT